ncbi:MAG: hypothetical protein HWN68_17665 [Desulfobacterales bacterium]|nr:hypothetical protein [Desulfobacterales bacterium]
MSWEALFMVLLLCITIVGISTNLTFGVTQPVIYVDPPTTTVVLGKSFTINMSIVNVTYPESGQGIYGWECDMSFNASILQVVDVEEGPFLKQAGDTMWATPVIDNTAGTIITGDQLEPPWPTWGAFSYSGVVMLANITFQTKAEGESHLNFTYTKLNTYTGTGPPPPVDHTVVNGSATVTPGHDAAVVSVTAPDEAASDSSVPIDVTVKNEGSFTENVAVTVYYNETYIDSKNVANLAGGTQNTTTFTWDTTDVSKGEYIINATATIPVENDPTDNWKNTTIRIVEHDVAVIDLEAPPGAKPGSTVPINVTVVNQGSNQETALNVTVSYDGNLIGFNDTVVLDPQTNTTVPFSWNTASLPIGDYTLNATATIPVDDDPTDNSKNKTITLYLIHDVAVISLEVEYDPEEPYSPVGEPIPINVTVRNEGDYLEDVNVTLRYGSTYIDSQNITLAQGANQTLSFTWSTTGLTPGSYIVKATASLNYTDTWTGDGAESFYTTRKPVDLGSEKVYVNQTLKTKPADYTIDYETGNITFTTAPGEGAEVKAVYFARDDDYPGDNYKTETIILTVHDVAVVSITAPSWASSGSKVPINITVKDEGSWRETINLTLKYDDTLIGNKTFDVYKDQSTTVSFTWNTTSVSYGNYTLSATATVLPSPSNSGGIDDDPTDNTLDDGTIFITITGDANGDRKVDKSDLSELNAAYGSAPGDANWNERCDFNGDNKVDALDLFDLGKNYGKSI